MELFKEIKEPDYEDYDNQPQTLTKSRTIQGNVYVAGRAPLKDVTHYPVMCVTSCVEEEEASSNSTTSYGFKIHQPPEYLKGSSCILKDLALSEGIDMDKDVYYTAICKWLLPRAKRSKPAMKALKWGLPILEDEIKRVAPKIIVCLGKPAFDLIGDTKISFKDAHGGWFWSERYNAHLYVMHTPYALVAKPELYEGFRIDFAEIKRKKDIIEGHPINDIPINYTVIDSESKLTKWVDEMIASPNRLFCADCEWHGRTYFDLDLRMIQFAWNESDAVVIEMRDENNQWAFDIDVDLSNCETDRDKKKANYAAVGAILGRLMNLPETRFIGHHFSADSPVMNYWLGINTYEKCEMDTEFAQQCIDEASELGLERGIAMRYTTLGLYDLDLTMWKKANKSLVEDGYGYIPRELIIPYAVKDVIAPMRAYPFLLRQLQGQKLLDYYTKIFNPFVTDVFNEFTTCGLPMNVKKMEDMRELFHYARAKLEKKLNWDICARAREQMCIKWAIDTSMAPITKLLDAMAMSHVDDAMRAVSDYLPLERMAKWNTYFEHLFHAPSFNIRSSDDMRRWLFDVEELTPVKSTNRKSQGMPSQAWENVLELPPDRQKMFTPAVDKQTILILAEQLQTLQRLLDLNAVGNICKAFLKEPEIYIDDFTGEEVIEEQGLFQWLTSDCRVCGMFSATETGRPRSWKPNTLNWPSFVQERINRAIAEVLYEDYIDNTLPESLHRWIVTAVDEKIPRDELKDWIKGKIPSVRSFVEAPEGWILVECDYKTAEMVA